MAKVAVNKQVVELVQMLNPAPLKQLVILVTSLPQSAVLPMLVPPVLLDVHVPLPKLI